MEPDPRFWSGRRVCVTGGTGLLGYQVVRALTAFGSDVRVLALPPRGKHPLQDDPTVDVRWGDVRDPSAVRRAVADCDVVFHLAGAVAVWGPALRRIHDVHASGTANVLNAVTPGTRVVVTSSVVTVGAARTPSPLVEESEFNLGRVKIDYVHAKRAAERIALRHAERGGDVVVVNPGYLIGPEDHERSVMGRFCVRYWRGMIPAAPPGGVNLVDVRDAARGQLLAAERGTSGRRYILGGENLTFAAFMSLLADVSGMRPRAIPILPWWGYAALARCGEIRAMATHRHPYPSIQHARLNRYYWFYNSDRAADELGYTFRPVRAALADAFAWFSGFKTLRPTGAGRWWMRAA